MNRGAHDHSSKQLKRALIVGIIFLIITTVGAWLVKSRFNVVPSLVATTSLPETSRPFPDLDDSQLSADQQKIISLLRQEYASQPAGTKYANGVEESWCADFVSWIMKESGMPLKNPHTGGWRIPGTYTLREYYQSAGAFRSAQSGYAPKLGDVVLYDNPSPHGQHTNIVIKNDNGLITTVGGNEGNKIRIQTQRLADDPGLIGYGIISLH